MMIDYLIIFNMSRETAPQLKNRKKNQRQFPPSSGSREKKGASQAALFSAFSFQRTNPSSGRRRLAASLVLEFHRREWNRGSPNRCCPRGAMPSCLDFAWLYHPLKI